MLSENPNFYRRNLPHFQPLGKPVFITFNTLKRWHLPETVRSEVLRHCLHENGKKIQTLCAVVMPDHVHLIFDLLSNQVDIQKAVAKIAGSIKGFSALTINRLLNRRGSVWQDESLDHTLRSDEQGWVKVEYVINNPVRKGICEKPCEYPWLWASPDLLVMRDLPVSVREVIERRNLDGR